MGRARAPAHQGGREGSSRHPRSRPQPEERRGGFGPRAGLPKAEGDGWERGLEPCGAELPPAWRPRASHSRKRAGPAFQAGVYRQGNYLHPQLSAPSLKCRYQLTVTSCGGWRTGTVALHLLVLGNPRSYRGS